MKLTLVIAALTTLAVKIEAQGRRMKKYARLVLVADHDKLAEIVLLCGLCKHHNVVQRNGAITLV